MQDERTMILNMLKEKKISVEEAEALLEALAEDKPEEGGGFSTADDKVSKAGRKGGKHGDGKKSGKWEFDFDFDFSELGESLRETMKGVSRTVREAMKDVGDLDLEIDINNVAKGMASREERKEFSEPAGDAAGLIVETRWGDVRVRGLEVDDPSDIITVRADISIWGMSGEEAASLAESINPRLELEGDQWVIRSGIEESHAGKVRIEYDITLPRRLGVAVKSISGDIHVVEIDGPLALTSISGDISAEECGGTGEGLTAVKTRSGDVRLRDVSGRCAVKSVSGDLLIEGFFGSLETVTTSGDITVAKGSGSVRSKTESGDVIINLNELNGEPLSLNSISGDVAVNISDEAGIDLSAGSTSGDISINLDLDNEVREEHAVSGSCNGGGVDLEIQTVSGDVTVAPLYQQQ